MGNNGNIAYIADNVNPGWTQTFTYDGLNRLLTGARSDGHYNHTYNYDSFGNLTILPLGGWPSGQVYSTDSATNRLMLTANGAPEYTYDAAGNVVNSGTGDIGGHAFSYNALNQIAHVDAGATASYYYNAQDQRIFVANTSAWTNYYYFAGQPLAEFNLSGIWTDYIYAGGQKIAKLTLSVNPNLYSPPTLNYYLDDHLGTTQVELDASGNVTWQGQFTPFGSELPDGSTTMHYKFTGKERDAESGLDYFGARYYGSAMGRWVSPDWSEKPEAVPYSSLKDPQSLDLYSYVGNNPLKQRDPDGHHQECAPDTSSTDKNGVLTVTAGACHEVPDWWQFQGARRFLGRHKTAVKVTSNIVIGVTAISGVLDGGASELAIPEEIALEEALIEGGEVAAEEAAEVGGEKAGEVASEKTAKYFAKRIEKELGKDARREFHDEKMGGGGDRTLQQLKDDARAIFENHGKTPPSWTK